jgi:hypothetical protein
VGPVYETNEVEIAEKSGSLQKGKTSIKVIMEEYFECILSREE